MEIKIGDKTLIVEGGTVEIDGDVIRVKCAPLVTTIHPPPQVAPLIWGNVCGTNSVTSNGMDGISAFYDPTSQYFVDFQSN